MNAAARAPRPKTHTVRLRFTESDEDQALYRALIESGERAYRTDPHRQIRFLLLVLFGLKKCLFLGTGLKAWGAPVDFDPFADPLDVGTFTGTRPRRQGRLLRLVPPGDPKQEG